MKSTNHERYYPVVCKLSNISFIDKQDISFLLEPEDHNLCSLSYCHVYSVTDDDFFFRLPGKHLGRIVLGFYVHHGSTILQSGLYSMFM